MLRTRRNRKHRGGQCPCKAKMFGGRRTRSKSLVSRLRKMFRL